MGLEVPGSIFLLLGMAQLLRLCRQDVEWDGRRLPHLLKAPKPRSLAFLFLLGGHPLYSWIHLLAPSASPPQLPFLWQELLDSTFSWYHGALTFPLMPSQEDKEDEDEDEECPAEKAKRKSPEEESRAPPDLARHDVIKVKGQLLSHPMAQGMSTCWKEGSSVPGAQLHLSVGFSLQLPGAPGYQPAASAALLARGDLPRTCCGP